MLDIARLRLLLFAKLYLLRKVNPVIFLDMIPLVLGLVFALRYRRATRWTYLLIAGFILMLTNTTASYALNHYMQEYIKSAPNIKASLFFQQFLRIYNIFQLFIYTIYFSALSLLVAGITMITKEFERKVTLEQFQINGLNQKGQQIDRHTHEEATITEQSPIQMSPFSITTHTAAGTSTKHPTESLYSSPKRATDGQEDHAELTVTTGFAPK